MSAPGVLEHKHCEVCGKPVPVDVRVCDEACQKGLDASIRAKKRGMYMFVGLIFLLLIITQLDNFR